MDYLNLASDRRPLDIQALLGAGFFSPATSPDSSQEQRLEVEKVLDQFSLQTGVDEEELSRVLEQMLRDPKLLEQLNRLREEHGLPPIEPGQRPGQALGDLQPNELMSLLVMWALQQENNKPASPPRPVGNLPQSNFSNVRPASWGNNSGGGNGGGGGGGGSTSSTGGGGSRPSAVPGGPVPDLPKNLGPVTPGQNGVPAGLKPNAARGAAVVREVFGFDGTIGGIGQRSGPSDHPHGNAIDVMTMQNQAQGQQIADFMVKHAEELGVKYVIFNQRIASPSNGWQWTMMEDRGSPTANHMDHVHVSFH